MGKENCLELLWKYSKHMSEEEFHVIFELHEKKLKINLKLSCAQY